MATWKVSKHENSAIFSIPIRLKIRLFSYKKRKRLIIEANLCGALMVII